MLNSYLVGWFCCDIQAECSGVHAASFRQVFLRLCDRPGGGWDNLLIEARTESTPRQLGGLLGRQGVDVMVRESCKGCGRESGSGCGWRGSDPRPGGR